MQEHCFLVETLKCAPGIQRCHCLKRSTLLQELVMLVLRLAFSCASATATSFEERLVLGFRLAPRAVSPLAILPSFSGAGTGFQPALSPDSELQAVGLRSLTLVLESVVESRGFPAKH